MSVPFETIFNKLQYASPVKAKQILRDLEGNPDELIQFCRQARRLSDVKAAALSKILEGMSNPEFLQLLKDYALSDDDDLRDTAFGTLSQGNNSARKEVMLELLKSGKPIIRQKACEAIGHDIDSEVEKQLTKLLDDTAVNVVRAALLVLTNSKHRAVIKSCEHLLDHEDVEVRYLALGIVGNEDAGQFAVKRVARCLIEDKDDRVRIEACRILSIKNPQKASKALIGTLQDKTNSDTLRKHAVLAVARINGEEAASILFNIIIDDKFCSVVVGECRKVLGRLDPRIVIRLAEGKFINGTVLEKFECVRIIGMFASREAEDFLESKLSSSQNEVVLAAILEQLAKSGVSRIWNFVVKEATNRERMVLAYSASQAASELLIPELFDDYVGILKSNPPQMVAEVVLKRLVVYGRDRGLPASITNIIQSYLKGECSALSLFAIDAAGYVEGEVLILQLLGLVAEYSKLELMEELTASIMQGVNGSLYKLLIIAGEDHLREVSAILSRVNRNVILGDFNEFFAYLASKAESKISGAQLCLTISASRFHREYVQALSTVSDKELSYLLFTWSSLPQTVRERSNIDWRVLLDSGKLAVRVAALRAMTKVDIEKNIADVSDIAFSDPRSEGREAAARALRGLLNT